MGSIFIQTQLPELSKAFFVAVPFVGMILDMTSFWLLVFVSPAFAILGILFGALVALAFFLIIGRPLYEMWILPLWEHRWKDGRIPWFLR